VQWKSLYTIETKKGIRRRVIMGQQEVYDFLCKNKGKWFTSREISDKLKVSIGSVTMSLKKLRKTNLIKYKNTGKRNTYQYTVGKR
jgi:DNA-binding transcriptional regulator GbsR (MarR family)